MGKNGNFQPGRTFSDSSWLLPLLASLLVTLTLFLATIFGLFSPNYTGEQASLDILSNSTTEESGRLFGKSDAEKLPETNSQSESDPPRIAYLITGTKGDTQRIKRTLQAVYHPRNRYILHLDLEAPPRERIELSMYVKDDPMFSEVDNVRVIAKANLVTYKGPTMIACTLHAIAILLKESTQWDWFINLSVSDYPLMTQDDILHVFSSLPRELNFIEHTQSTGWKLNQRARQVIIDPGLYLSKKFDVVTTTERRELPTTFNLFTGSAWVMLTRSFLEHCIWGWDNLPRTILMYYVNFISSPEGYFHTVICNSDKYRNTTISHDLHHIAWDTPPKQHPRMLTMKDFDKMVKSGSPFARKFASNDPILAKIDRELLGRLEGQFTPGAWCIGGSKGEVAGPCSSRGDDSIFRPGPGAERLRELIQKLQSKEVRDSSCTDHSFDKTKNIESA